MPSDVPSRRRMALGLVLIMVLQVTMVHPAPVADRLRREAEVAYATASIGASGDTTLNLSEGAQGTLGSESTLTIGQVGQPAQLLPVQCGRTRSSPRRRWNSPAMRRMAMPAPLTRNGSGRRPSSSRGPSPVPTPLRSSTGTNWTGNIIDMEAFFERFARVTSGSFQRVELDVTYLAQRALAEGTGHVNLLLRPVDPVNPW